MPVPEGFLKAMQDGYTFSGGSLVLGAPLLTLPALQRLGKRQLQRRRQIDVGCLGFAQEIAVDTQIGGAFRGEAIV